jgi:hypothetical protein
MANMTNEGLYVTKTGRTYRSPPGRPLREEPTNPRMVLRVVRMRELENMRWRQIAEKLELSRQAPFLMHKRWREWALPLIYK